MRQMTIHRLLISTRPGGNFGIRTSGGCDICDYTEAVDIYSSRWRLRYPDIGRVRDIVPARLVLVDKGVKRVRGRCNIRINV
jgi:hypothetical protein